VKYNGFLLQNFHVNFSQQALLYYDNQSTSQIIANQVFHEQTNHIGINCLIVQEKINKGLIKLLPIASTLQATNIYIKPLTPGAFKNMFTNMGMLNIYFELDGSFQNFAFCYFHE